MEEKTKKPTKIHINKLIEFLPVFSQEGYQPIKEWGGGGTTEEGAILMQWPIYQEEVEEFFRLAAEEQWCDYQYSPEQVAIDLNNVEVIREASLEKIVSMLTFSVRGERFCDGHWGSMIERGIISNLLLRLVEIADEL